MIIQLKLPVPDPRAPTPTPFCCLHHVLWRFICCFHVRMSPFTVNNWCGLSKPSKKPASSASAPRALIKKNYAVTSDIISICTHSTQNHFELKINDSLAHVPCFRACLFWSFSNSECVCVCVCLRVFACAGSVSSLQRSLDYQGSKRKPRKLG